ncbi:MAG: ribonuclease D [Bradymonadia bacterium]
MTPEFINDYEALDDALERLNEATVIALDTEFESNRSGTTLSLIQLTDGTQSFVIDALALTDLDGLIPMLTSDAITWVVHAGRQDVDLIAKATHGHRPARLFDTQVGWALCGPEYQVSLAYLVAALCDTRLPKGHQNDYWLKRPLDVEQIRYAADDVKYLHHIFGEITNRLGPLNKIEIAFEVTQETMRPASSRSKTVTLASYRNLWQLDHRQRGALIYLIQWYQEELASRGKKPVHHKVLYDIAAALPETVADLAAIKSVPARFAHGTGGSVLKPMIAAAEDAKPLPDTAPPSPYGSYQQLYSDAWLHCARVEICQQAQITVELGFPQWLQNDIRTILETHSDPRAAQTAFKGWRRFLRTYWVGYCEDTFGL